MDRAPIAHVINDVIPRQLYHQYLTLPSERSESSNRKINKWFLSAHTRWCSRPIIESELISCMLR